MSLNNISYEDKILDLLKPEDLTEDMQYIVSLLGFKVVKDLMRAVGGSRISIPLPSSYASVAVERYLKKGDNNHLSTIKIAREFNMSTAQVLKIAKEKSPGVKPESMF